MKNTFSFNSLMRVSLPALPVNHIVARDGSDVSIAAEALYSVDYKILTATAKPFNFGMVKINREVFAKAIQGEFFARELAKVEAEAAKVAGIDEAFFAEAAEEHTPEEIAEAREKVKVMRERINIARDFLSPTAKESNNLTVLAIVSAMRSESMPARLAKAAEDMRIEARKIDDITHMTFSAKAIEEAREIVSHREDFGEVKAAEALNLLAQYEAAEGIDETIPNVRFLREAVTAFIKDFWIASPAEGIEKVNFKCSHALAVEVFQRYRNARSISRKGNVFSSVARADDVAREVVFAFLEALQAKAREAAKAEAAEAAKARKAATAKAKAAKAAEAKAKAKGTKAAEVQRMSKAAEAAEAAEAKAKAKAAEAEAKAAKAAEAK